MQVERGNYKLFLFQSSQMDLVSNLLPAVPNLGLDPTSQYQNTTILLSMFASASLGTFDIYSVSGFLKKLDSLSKPEL